MRARRGGRDDRANVGSRGSPDVCVRIWPTVASASGLFGLNVRIGVSSVRRPSSTQRSTRWPRRPASTRRGGRVCRFGSAGDRDVSCWPNACCQTIAVAVDDRGGEVRECQPGRATTSEVTAKEREELIAGRRQGLGHLQQREREERGNETHGPPNNSGSARTYACLITADTVLQHSIWSAGHLVISSFHLVIWAQEEIFATS